MYSSIKTTFLGVSLILLFGLTVNAQKPVAERAFEIKINTEEASFHLDNKRMSTESGYPLAIYNPDFSLNPDTPENMGRQYLELNKSLLGLSDSDLQSLELHAVRQGPSGTTVRFRQKMNGLAVNKAELTISINNKNTVSFLSNSFQYGVSLNSFEPALSEEAALERTLNQLGTPMAYSEVTNELKIFHHRGETYLVYNVIVLSENPLGEWQAYVDAQTGELLKLEDISFYYKDHHDELQPGIPLPEFSFYMLLDGTGNVFDPDPLSSANAEYNDTGFTDNSDNTSTQLDDEMVSKTLLDITFDGSDYSLVGPWAEIIDFESPFRGLFEQSSSTWDIDRSDNAFEAVNTYYHIDASMRYLNDDLGLDIRPDEYAGGVQFDPHGLNGSDNSHYIRSSQRVSFGEGGVDDAEDSDVIHHELGHGLHDWVTNGSLSQVNGLSEGSGDYWAASYNRHLNDWDPADDQYHWVFNWDGHNPFWNGRSVNYGAMYPGGLTGAIHTDGQIWATCMMKVWDELGRTQTDKAFWEGLGDTNSSSNQDDAANAVYQAALDMDYPHAELEAMHDEMTNTGYMLPELPLPVELSSFTGNKMNKTVKLVWTTASENQSDYFVVERSVDGDRFESIGVVDAAGNSLSSNRYVFVDEQPLTATNYYRLKQMDQDERFEYSKVISVLFDSDSYFRLFPNPVTNKLFIQSNILEESDIVVTLFDSTGKEISYASLDRNNLQTFSVDVSNLPDGIYSLRIESNGDVRTERFYKK